MKVLSLILLDVVKWGLGELGCDRLMRSSNNWWYCFTNLWIRFSWKYKSNVNQNILWDCWLQDIAKWVWESATWSAECVHWRTCLSGAEDNKKIVGWKQKKTVFNVLGDCWLQDVAKWEREAATRSAKCVHWRIGETGAADSNGQPQDGQVECAAINRQLLADVSRYAALSFRDRQNLLVLNSWTVSRIDTVSSCNSSFVSLFWSLCDIWV